MAPREYLPTDWVDASLAGDLDESLRAQYNSALDARLGGVRATVEEVPEDYLPDKRVPAPPCPGFERLDKIMSIPMDEPECINLATYKPVWSGGWASAMSQINEEQND